MARTLKAGNNGSVEKLIDFRKIRAIIRKNWLVISRDPLRLRMLFLFPLVMILIFGYTSGRSPTLVPAAIVDYDSSLSSRQLQSYIYGSNLFSVKHQFGSQDEGRKLIDEGKIKTLFVIPAGFEDDINSGRTATVTVVVDESDPTIAQMTRASTQVFIQQVSQQLASSRISAISVKAGVAERQLAYASGSIDSVIASRDDDHCVVRIDSNFRDASYVGSTTNAMLSGAVQASSNAVADKFGEMRDQNEVIDAFNNGSVSDARYALSGIAVSHAQDVALQPTGIYAGLQYTNAKLMQDAAGMYSASKELAANSARDRELLKVSYEQVNSASATLKSISDDASKAATGSLALSEVHPYGSGRPGMDFLLPSMLAMILFQGAVMGLGRAVAGERRDGSLTRVFLTPTSNTTIIAGTQLFYVLFEAARSTVIVAAAMFLFGVSIKGSILDTLIIISVYAAGATGLGMIMSVLAKSQEQYMAISMLVSLPTMFLSGVFLPVEVMPKALQSFTKILPVTYAADAFRGIIIKGFTLSQVIPDLTFLVLFALATTGLSVMLFKREMV